MNILVVSQYFWPENFRINDICISLKEKNHDITVITGLPNVPDGKFYDGYSWFKKGSKMYKGIEIIRVPITPRGKDNFLLLTINCLSYFINALFYIPMLIRKKFDVIFVFQVSPISSAIPAIVLKNIIKIPTYIYVQDIWPESMYYLLNLNNINHSIFHLFNNICSAIYRSFDCCYITSQAFKDILIKKGVVNTKIEYLPQWSEQDNIMEYDKELARNLGVELSDFVLTFTGNIGRAQGFDLILDVVESIYTKGFKNIKWILVGDGTEFQNIKRRVKEKHLEKVVILEGWKPIENMPRYYSISNALFLALKEDFIAEITLPGKVQSYMSSGKPIIASLGGEGERIINESGCGFSSKPGNAAAFEENILKLYNMNPEERTKMGESGLKYSQKIFNKESLIDFLESNIQIKNKFGGCHE